MNDKELRQKVADMTLQEKLLEMTQCNYSELGLNQTGDVTGVLNESGKKKETLRRIGSTLNIPNAEEALRFRKIREENGVKEPVVIMHDVIHGFCTQYPIPLAMSSSFDFALIEDCAEMSAEEAKYGGIDLTFSPMVDLVRDPRWGRVMESAGEDPFWSGEVGKAFIRGYHKGGIACCVKHFAAYGASESGKDYNTTDVSTHSLRQYYLRPYQACMEEKPDSVMSSFNALNGIPTVADEWLMVDVLRNEWGFDGVLISDWGSITMMKTHGYVETDAECALAALKTKHDIEMCSTSIWKSVPQFLESGIIKIEDIDDSVFRILKLKDKLGMYENPNRFVSVEKFNEVCLSEKHRELARKAAEDSCILLKNGGSLPLSKTENVGFVGPFYDEQDIIGNWRAKGKVQDAVSVRKGVESLLKKETVFVAGCSAELLETDESGIDAAVDKMRTFDKIVACVGEPCLNSGEHHSRADIRLPKVQRKLICRLSELGKPIVLVVFGGRPQVLTDVEPFVDSILYAWQPGTEGGNAIANILYGKTIPSAKTPMTFPRSVGQIPVYYNHFNTGHPKNDDSVIVTERNFGSCYDDEFNAPLYPFGYGLSYTSFNYSNLKLSATELKKRSKIVAEVDVENIGNYDGKEVVQWYIRDKFASCVRPVKELKHIEKIFLKKGEKKTVRFEIDEKTLAFYGESNELIVEKGTFEIFVGGNSRDCLTSNFKLL